jgi:hypothetical protein
MRYCYESYLDFLQSASLNQGVGNITWYGSSPRRELLTTWVKLIRTRRPIHQHQDHK